MTALQQPDADLWLGTQRLQVALSVHVGWHQERQMSWCHQGLRPPASVFLAFRGTIYGIKKLPLTPFGAHAAFGYGSLTICIPIWDNLFVDILNLDALTRFSRRHPLSRVPLSRWIDIAKVASWKSVIDVQKDFRTAESVEGYVVFNIHGNDYRLITVIRYEKKQVIVHDVFTHRDYDRWKP